MPSTARLLRPRSLSLGLLLLLAAATAESATLRGRVTDAETGEPLPYAAVRVDAGGVQTGVLADENGRFEKKLLPAGPAVLRISFIGYEELERRVQLSESRPLGLDIALTPSAIEMDRVEVRADPLETQRKALTGLVTLEKEDIEALPALGEQDPIRALELMPGVQSASDISSGLYVRGGGPDQNLILLDEVTVYNPTHAFGLFSTFNSDVVDQVRLYKGAFPARYGGRIGSVLDVRNKPALAPKVSGRGSLSTITGKLMLEGPAAGGHWIGSLRRTYLEPFLNAIRNEDNQIPSYYFYDFNGRYWHPGPEDGSFLVTGYLGQDDLRLDLDVDSFLDIRWGNQVYSGKYQHVFGRDVTGSLLLSGSLYDSKTSVQIFTTPIEFSNRLEDVSLGGDLSWFPSTEHHVLGGVMASWYDFTYRESFNFDDQLTYRSRPIDVSAFVEDEWSRPGGTIYGAGVRFRHFSEGDRLLFEPRVSASWPFDGNKRFKLGAGIYHQYLQLVTTEGFSAGDFYLPVDGSSPPPRSVQGVAGLEWRPSLQYELRVEGYYTDLANLLTLNTLRSADTGFTETADAFVTGGTGWASGVELFLQRRTGTITGWVGYTLGWTRRTFDSVDGGEAYPPKYDRRHDLSVVANHERGKWQFGAAFLYATGQAFTPVTARYSLANPATDTFTETGNVLPGSKNSARLLPYHRLDVSVFRDLSVFGQPAQAFLQVFNLYSRRNEWFVQYDGEGGDPEPVVAKMLPIIPSLGIRFDF